MRLLVVIGAGYGNTVFATPLLKALHEMRHLVDVLFDGEYPDLHLVFKDTEYVSSYAYQQSDLPIPTANYDAVLNTLWAERTHNNECQMFTRKKQERVYHEAEINYDLAAQLEHLGPMPMPFFSNIEWVNCGEYIGINIPIQKSPRWERKSYPHWDKLIPALQEIAPVRLFGTEAEVALWEGWCDTVASADVYEYAHLVSKARCFVGTDNGPSHIASVIGCPSVLIYGGSGIAKNMPIGPNTMAVTPTNCDPCLYTARWEMCETPQKCLDVRPSVIISRVKELLNESV